MYFVGKRSNDPQSSSYSPSIFGQTRDARDLTAMQQQRRYETVQHRQRIRNEAEVVDEGDMSEDAMVKMSEDAMETDQPSSTVIGTSPESLEASFKSLEEDYQIRLEELHAAKQGANTVFGSGFPDESKQDDKLTARYTSLPSYTILMSMFRYTTASGESYFRE